MTNTNTTILINARIAKCQMEKPSPRILYLPVETAARELDAKLLLSLYAVREGFTVILGNRQLLNLRMHRMPHGIYLAHNVDKGRRRILRIIHQSGHRIAAWDEEGLVWLSPEAYLKRRISKESMRHVSRFYAWGAEQAEALRKGGVRTPIIETGNPRADLLRPPFRAAYEKRARALREKHGDFILINSNFGWLNYALGKRHENIDEHLRHVASLSGHPLNYLRNRWEVYQAIRALAETLSREFAHRRIIIRPHPSETPAAWQDLADRLENVFVHYDDELIPWLLAADAIIHNGCTTAVEAALLGKTPISYEPETPAQMPPMAQPSAVSLRARSEEEVCAIINGLIRHDASSEAALARMVAGLEEDLPSAARIAADLARLEPPATRKVARVMALVKGNLRNVEKKIVALRKKSSANPAYVRKKFPPISAEKIEARLRNLASFADLAPPAVRALSDRIFEIRRQT